MLKAKKTSNNKKNIAAIVVLTVVLISIIFVDFIRSRDPYFAAADMAMGSEITVKAYGFGKAKTAESIINKIKTEEEQYWSRNINTAAVAKINAAEFSMTVDSRVVQMLNEIIEICKDTGGELDLTIGTLSELWAFDTTSPHVPSVEEIAKALEGVSYTNIAIDGSNVFIRNNGKLDLGAFGKGIACDVAKKAFLDSNIKGGIISVGGSIYVHGKPKNKDTWSVGIRNPDKTVNDFFAVLELNDLAISTSGAYEKGFTSNGTYYHHILSPVTGMPVNSEFKSVSVISKSGIVSDALSSACFILGYEKSLPLLEKYNSDAVFVYPDNSVVITNGLNDKITIQDSAFKLREADEIL